MMHLYVNIGHALVYFLVMYPLETFETSLTSQMTYVHAKFYIIGRQTNAVTDLWQCVSFLCFFFFFNLFCLKFYLAGIPKVMIWQKSFLQSSLIYRLFGMTSRGMLWDLMYVSLIILFVI